MDIFILSNHCHYKISVSTYSNHNIYFCYNWTYSHGQFDSKDFIVQLKPFKYKEECMKRKVLIFVFFVKKYLTKSLRTC